MKLKASALLLASLIAAAPAATAADAPSASYTLTTSFVSQYMFRGMRLGGASLQPSLEMAYGNLGVGVWVNAPLASRVPNQSDPEIDPYAYYTFAFGDNLSVVPGITLYTYPGTDIGAGYYRSTLEPSLAVNYTVAGLKLTPKVYFDSVLDGATWEITAAYTVPMKDLGTELGFTATYGSYKWTDAVRNAAPKFKNYGDYWLIGVSAPFALGEKSKIVTGLAYTKGWNNYFKQGTDGKTKNGGAVGRGVLTISYILSF